MHGIAMHGMPKYDKNFKYLDYVNPNAPKGGILRYGVYGSFDNLNRVAFKGRKAAGLGTQKGLIPKIRKQLKSIY